MIRILFTNLKKWVGSPEAKQPWFHVFDIQSSKMEINIPLIRALDTFLNVGKYSTGGKKRRRRREN